MMRFACFRQQHCRKQATRITSTPGGRTSSTVRGLRRSAFEERGFRMKRTVWLGRHASHEGNVLTEDGFNATHDVGQRLGELYQKLGDDRLITTVISSPRFRAISTGVARIEGYLSTSGRKAPIMTADAAFDSFESEGDEAVQQAKAAAKAAGKETEDYLVSAFELHETMVRRGAFAAKAVPQWLRCTEGDLLVESHGGSLLEVMLANLRGDTDFKNIPFMFERSSLAELTFELRAGEWVLLGYNYRDLLLLGADTPTRAPMPTPAREEATIDCGHGCL